MGGGFQYSWLKQLKKDQKKEFNNEVFEVWCEDALQYHDLSRDGVVTAEELGAGFLQWAVVHYRKKKASSLLRSGGKKPAAKLQAIVESEINVMKTHLCEDANQCPTVDELSSYGDSLSKNKAASKKKLKALQQEFGDEEGRDRDELLSMHDRESGTTTHQRL